MTRRFEGQAAIVTGGAAGIGLAVAKALYRDGASVVIADSADASAAALSIDVSGARVIGVRTDVRDDAQVDNCVTACISAYGRCDILVNNAGIATSIVPRPFDEIAAEEWHLIYDVNVVGVARFCRAVVREMVPRGGGRIVNIASAAAFKGVPLLLHYVSSKGALLALTKSLARELGDRNVLVNAVAPGFTLSQAARQNATQMAITRAGSLQGRSIARDEYPEDVVGAVLFFAGADSAFVTGQTLVVDGGTYMH